MLIGAVCSLFFNSERGHFVPTPNINFPPTDGAKSTCDEFSLVWKQSTPILR